MQQKFETWAILELFGHTRIAGLVSEMTIGGGAFIRIDVPETETQPAFTKMLNPSAIYGINPVDETTAKTMAASLDKKPIEVWDIRNVMKKNQLHLSQNESEKFDENDFDEDDHN